MYLNKSDSFNESSVVKMELILYLVADNYIIVFIFISVQAVIKEVIPIPFTYSHLPLAERFLVFILITSTIT